MGVKAGMNLATQSIEGDFPPDPKPRMRFHFGIIAEWRFSKFSFQPEWHYSGHGYQYDGATHSNLKVTFDYINVPLFAKYRITKQFSILAGPQFGMLFNHEFQDDSNSVDVIKEDYSTLFSRFETSIGGGFEYEFYNRTGLYIRYIHGITEIDGRVPYLNPTVAPFLSPTKNRTFQMGISYRF